MREKVTKIAIQWRKKKGYTGGVVVIHNNQVAGWMNELRSPENWQPGCLAVDEQGNIWTAVGGNEQDGAREWRR